MQTSEPVAQVGPPPAPFTLGWCHRHFSKLEDILNLTAAAAIFVLMFVGVAQIVGRTLLNTAIYGYIDWIEQTAIIYAMLGAAYCQREGGHIRMELLLASLRGRLLWAAESFAVLLALIIVAMVIYSTWANFMRAYVNGDSTMDIRLSLWPFKLLVPLSLSVLWLRLLLQLLGYLRLLVDPKRLPIAVPVVETVEQQAHREIEDALGRVTLPEANADARRK